MKNQFYIYLVLAALFAGFGVISVLVFLSKGQNKYFVKKKLALGASIIALTCMANGCKPVVTCYEVAVEPVIVCSDSVNNDGVIILNTDNQIINFDCQYMFYEKVSYKINNNSENIYTGDCVKTSSDTSVSLSITTTSILAPGNYKLQLYYFAATELDENSAPFSYFDLKVIE